MFSRLSGADRNRRRQNKVIQGEPGTLGTGSVLGGMREKSAIIRYAIVVVEDEADIRLIATEALADAGFDVFEAEHADAAVAILHERAREIHGLFTDVTMEGSMDGVALAHHTYRNWPWIVLLISSGRPRPLAESMPKGSRFLPKPYHPDHVVMHLREMLTA